ncbi:MAG TPA: periplasmic heavy metal sensor [Syntrophorhabdales bacterium]|nr:periplasmic heavy metal sensor [Syntrophorhabdales bacterium]
MKNNILLGLIVLVMLSCLAPSEAWSQFTQGPPGNPSAAGIMSGSPAPSGPSSRTPGAPMAPPQSSMAPAMGIPYATAEGGVLAAYLGLTRGQMDKCRDLRNRFYRETRDLRYDFYQKQLEMRKLFADPKVGEAKLLEKEKELSPLRQRLMDKVAETIIEGRKILTPEQIERLDQLPLWSSGMDIGPELSFLSGDMPMGAGEY